MISTIRSCWRSLRFFDTFIRSVSPTLRATSVRARPFDEATESFGGRLEVIRTFPVAPRDNPRSTARHMRAVLKAQINKTDRNDARGIAQMMRVGLYRPVHVKTLRSQKLRMLLTHRKLLQSKAIAIDNDLRGTLR